MKYTYNGREYDLSTGGQSGANWNLTATEKKTLLAAIVANGGPLSTQQLIDLKLINADANKEGTARFTNLQEFQNYIMLNNADKFSDAGVSTGNSTPALAGTQPATEDTSVLLLEDPKEQAFNAYYNDIYSLKPGTGGADMLSRLEKSYENQARGAMDLADAAYQSQAVQQAQTVKAITDQVRAERMSRLRAGMSESQIASQDMQMMMANVNALNENVQLANQARLEAQVGKNIAKDMAFADYLEQSNARGQNAAAMYAADSGNAYWNTVQEMRTKFGTDSSKWTTAQWDTARKNVTGTTGA